jgi:hypothetical protein
VQDPADHADGGGLSARAGHANAQGGIVEEIGKKPRTCGDSGADTPRGLHVWDRFLDSRGGDQSLTGPAHAATVLRMKSDAMRAQKIKSFGIASLVEGTVGTLHSTASGLDDQSERGHATTADAAEKIISWPGHRRNLQALPIDCNARRGRAGWTDIGFTGAAWSESGIIPDYALFPDGPLCGPRRSGSG